MGKGQKYKKSRKSKDKYVIEKLEEKKQGKWKRQTTGNRTK